jgi:putative addiction module component (TIGR02574 family)
MTQDASELLKRALALTPEERAELAGSLLESLDAADDDPKAVEAAWNEEIARRIEDFDSGKTKAVPWEEVQARISSKLTHGR